MKPFNLKQALAGKPVVTRDRRYKVVEMCMFKTEGIHYPLQVAIEDDDHSVDIETFTVNGRRFDDEEDSCYDLFMAEETIQCNGFEVPKPESEALEDGDMFFLPLPHTKCDYSEYMWGGSYVDQRILKRGLVHLSKENAIKHSRAMRGVNPEGDE